MGGVRPPRENLSVMRVQTKNPAVPLSSDRCSAVAADLRTACLICSVAGIVSSNARDLAASVTYPHLNFIIPVPVFQRPLQEFQKTRNVDVFSVLNATERDVRRVWRLQGAQSKL